MMSLRGVVVSSNYVFAEPYKPIRIHEIAVDCRSSVKLGHSARSASAVGLHDTEKHVGTALVAAKTATRRRLMSGRSNMPMPTYGSQCGLARPRLNEQPMLAWIIPPATRQAASPLQALPDRQGGELESTP
jgi:hypothetical protein